MERVIPISGIDSDGNVADGKVIVERDNKIKGEIIQLLKSHNLTIGQATSLLRECIEDIHITAYQDRL